MKRARLAVALLAALAVGSTGLAAQQKKTPAQDSLKALKKEIKADKAEIAAAKKSGDTVKVKRLTAERKADKAKRDSLKMKGGGKKKVPLGGPPKKP